MKPLFLFSLPRSGSTLLQRMLAGHSAIQTAPEPWVMLALAGLKPGEGAGAIYASYSRHGLNDALRDFVDAMPAGTAAYDEILREAATKMYEAASSRSGEYFLDKTPRYFLIIDFILDLFPDSPAIALIRHPLDVLASVIRGWGGGRLWIHNALLDLYHGPVLLHEAMRRRPTRFLRVEYENLVAEPATVCRALCSHLELSYEEEMTTASPETVTRGEMGDKSENIHRREVVGSSIGSWREVLATPVRREFARRYIRRLGPDVLATFGSDLGELDGELRALPTHWERTLEDLACLAASFAAPAAAATVIRGQWRGRFPMTKLD